MPAGGPGRAAVRGTKDPGLCAAGCCSPRSRPGWLGSVTAMSVRTSIHLNATPAIAGPVKKPICMENVSQPIARPSLDRETDSVTALNRDDCCIPAARPPITCHRNRGATLGVSAIATWEPPVKTSEIASRFRDPKRSTSTPAGSESTAPASVATEKSAPTSNRFAPRSCAKRGTVSPRAAMVAKTAAAAR